MPSRESCALHASRFSLSSTVGVDSGRGTQHIFKMFPRISTIHVSNAFQFFESWTLKTQVATFQAFAESCPSSWCLGVTFLFVWAKTKGADECWLEVDWNAAQSEVAAFFVLSRHFKTNLSDPVRIIALVSCVFAWLDMPRFAPALCSLKVQ